MKNHKGYKLPEKIGVVHSHVKEEYFPTRAQYITEKDAIKDASRVGAYISKLNMKPVLIPANNKLPLKLTSEKVDMVINLADSFKGNEYLSSSIPGVLELLEIPYTGADILGKSLDTNKFLIKKLLQQNGIPIPNYQLFNTDNESLNSTLRFPLISKLNEIHGGVEITKDAISENEKHLRSRLKYLIKTYKQSVLVEEFIVGREITGILLEGLNKKVYLAEKIFNKADEKYIFATFEDQWVKKGLATFTYKKYKDPILKEYIKKAFDVVKMYDYGKFDIRVDESGRYFFIDSNANPAFGPKENDCAMSYILDLYAVPFIEILKRLILNTLRDALGKKRLPIPNGD